VCHPDGAEAVVINGFLLPVAGGTGLVTLYHNTFDDGTGLTLEGGWAVGPPNQQAVGGPGAAYTGEHVLGTWLDGNYPSNQTVRAALPPFSTLGRSNVSLQFRRWLGLAYNQTGSPASRHADVARIHYSVNNTTWSQVWASAGAFNENGWTLQSYSLPSAANERSQVWIRFELQTDNSVNSYGWNIDDLQVTSVSNVPRLPPVFVTTPPGDLVLRGAPFSYVVEVSDADTPPAALDWSASSGPSWLGILVHGDGTATVSGIAESAGEFPVQLAVSDGDYTTFQSFTVAVSTESVPALSAYEVWAADLPAHLRAPDSVALADGIPNVLRYAAGLASTTLTRGQALSTTHAAADGSPLLFTYARRPGGQQYAIHYQTDDLRYTVQSAADFSGWQDVAAPVIAESAVSDTRSVVTVEVPSRGERTFVRLQVELLAAP
jgi:hypothetical protein